MVRRWKRWFAIFGATIIGVVVLALLLLQSAVHRRITAIRDAGDPVTYGDLFGEPVDDADNAAIILEQIKEELDSTWSELAVIDLLRDTLYCDREVEAAILEEHADVVAKLRQAASCKTYRHEVQFEDFPADISTFRNAVRILLVQSTIDLYRGNAEEALQTCVDALRLSRHVSKPPLVIHYLVSVAMQSAVIQAADTVLRSAQISSAKCEQLDVLLQAELAEENEMYAQVLKGERAYYFTALEKHPCKWYEYPLKPLYAATYLRVADARMQDVAIPIDEKLRQPQNQTTEHSQIGRLGLFLMPREMDPSILWLDDIRGESVARLRCLRVLLALERRSMETDKLPIESLGLSKDDIMDPFNGNPLRLIATDHGWSIYSIGRNRIDEGGQLSMNADIRLGPWVIPVREE